MISATPEALGQALKELVPEGWPWAAKALPRL